MIQWHFLKSYSVSIILKNLLMPGLLASMLIISSCKVSVYKYNKGGWNYNFYLIQSKEKCEYYFPKMSYGGYIFSDTLLNADSLLNSFTLFPSNESIIDKSEIFQYKRTNTSLIYQNNSKQADTIYFTLDSIQKNKNILVSHKFFTSLSTSGGVVDIYAYRGKFNITYVKDSVITFYNHKPQIINILAITPSKMSFEPKNDSINPIFIGLLKDSGLPVIVNFSYFSNFNDFPNNLPRATTYCYDFRIFKKTRKKLIKRMLLI